MPGRKTRTVDDSTSHGKKCEIRKFKYLVHTAQRGIEQVAEFIDSTDLKNVGNIVLNSKLNLLQECWTQYKDSHANLVSLMDDDNEFEEQLKLAADVDKMMSNCRNNIELNITVEQPTQAHEYNPMLTAPRRTLEARLPKIDIPQFNGNTEEWAPFYQMFSALVDSRSDLPSLVKFQYLLGAVRGNAFDMIKDLPLTVENYIEALALLKKRFDNPRLTVDRLISSIFDLPQISAESAEALRSMLDKTVAAVKALGNINYSLDKLADAIVVRIL
ncbi:MAG: DUF1759 domain-containing protein, partial [Spiroplasma ixodetis]|nr:DUF1759 domain-containing protein [Spiroplasma ixodetis]